ncbi:Hsp20/alpha crystallin family protein, partial [Bacteriovorax sp. DB6_IX]|uniref:Hsp20/alpha crystallin family protein n=1 Tax=Bacteriovorax sp. DB6_IX TaxID=1353530 RepID=UPI00038A0AD6
QEILKQKRTSFKEKFSLLEKNHTEILSRMKTKFDNEIKELVSKYSDFKNQTLGKLQDKFYHVTKLDPKVENKLDHYLVKIEIPEHEKELVNLTAQERDISISMTRKFTDKMTDQLGAKHKTRRSEVMNKSFQVPEIMDSASVVRNYDQGVLTFKIAKR